MHDIDGGSWLFLPNESIGFNKTNKIQFRDKTKTFIHGGSKLIMPVLSLGNWTNAEVSYQASSNPLSI